MSSKNGQNPSTATTFSNIVAPKVGHTTKQLVAKKSTKGNKVSKNMIKKNTNHNNKPLKVVYISNPIKFQVNVEEFQALVQGLTGRDATEWTDYNNNNDNHDAGHVSPVHGGGLEHDDNKVQHEPLMKDDQAQVDGYDESTEMDLDYFIPFDGVEDKGHMIGCYAEFPHFYD